MYGPYFLSIWLWTLGDPFYQESTGHSIIPDFITLRPVSYIRDNLPYSTGREVLSSLQYGSKMLGWKIHTDVFQIPDEYLTVPLVTIHGVEGKSVTLPCDLTPPNDIDKVHMVLWYKGTGNLSPIYR
ncbi:hypothetical protein M8J75_008644 [Diaphorina citri]|nr:hypothetical protein M8J75_008644 [Diaphorina citri]